MITRRDLLKLSAAGIAGAALSTRVKFLQEAFAAYVADNTLAPASISKYVAPMVIPPAMPLSKGSNKNKDKYDIGVRQFGQQILPSGNFGPTTVWSYGSRDFPNTTFNYPAFTIEATCGKDTQVQWSNELVDALGNPLPHLLPVDPTLHWANPIGLRDTRPDPLNAAYWTHPYLAGTNGSYIGPVPLITHVHGAHTTEDSDGYPEAWFLPARAVGDPLITSSVGTYFDIFNAKYAKGWNTGKVSFKYPNNQRATTLWYHDHTLGMTRLNVYAGPAGFYLIRGGPDDVVMDSSTGMPAVLPGPAPGVGDSPFGTYYEIPIVIQDRSFDQNGQLWYPYYRAFFEELGDIPDKLQIPFIPNSALSGAFSDVSPIWQPEFFGNVMVVNGVSWPYLNVERRRYRFRLLNGCNSRFLNLDFSGIPGVKVWQIGADGGFLAAPVDVTAARGSRLLMAPAERADVIVDFTDVPIGNYILANIGPDEPFGGGEPPDDFDSADPNTTGQVMQFRVGAATGSDASTPPANLVLPAITPLVPTVAPRVVSLNEEESKTVTVPVNGDGDFVFDTSGTLWEVGPGEMPTETAPDVWTLARLPDVAWSENWSPGPFGPTSALLGTVDPATGNGVPMLWMAPVTENPAAGSTEMWEIHNFTMDAHPIHIHLVQFQVVGRYAADGVTLISGPEPGETGFKDTVIAYPDQVTKVIATYDTPGRFVWHCHIVEHEDNEMMRPYDVV